VQLRLATIDDAEAIRSIYNVEVETSTATFDLVTRSLTEQQDWLTQRSGAFSAIVAEDVGVVLGFASLSPYKERAAYRTTVEDSVYVHRDHHGRGIGRRMLSEVCEIAAASGFHTVIARIESNQEASQALHRACGFSLVGVEKAVGRKFHRWLDVTIMQRML
jgi:phosphinothricin acetyltransferase